MPTFLNTDTLSAHVNKLNELDSDFRLFDSDLGSRVSLTTDTDSSIVSAINELVSRVDNLDSTGVLSVLNVGTGASLDFDSDLNKLTLTNNDATTSVKGLASFNSDNFAVTSGDVTIKSGGIDGGAEIATNTITFDRFNSVVSLIIYDSSASAVKTLYSPGA